MYSYKMLIASPRGLLFALFVGAFGLVTVTPSNAQSCASSTPPSVLTAQYGNTRRAYNPSETVLTASCINNGTVTVKEASFSPVKVDTSALKPP